jgi:phosphoribosyl-ATP pyrophosphohydrolase/phosphoribosyl-AMP cyclohydrolase
MMIPSIDIQSGQAVQLIGGDKKAIDAGDPWSIAEKFARVGEFALIDLDAAMGVGSNAELMRAMCATYPCRVGGGIRDVQTAIQWLDAGARKVVLGTAATPDVLAQLPKERVIAALDARNDRVVVEGWKTTTQDTIEDRMRALDGLVSGYLVTFVEYEGRMQGIPLDRIERLVKVAGDAKLTAAGGVRTADEIARVDQLGADVQVGMALYTGAIDLAEGLCAPLRSDRSDGLWPTVVCDDRGTTLGLVYSNEDSVRCALDTGSGVYYSRSRDELWRKGASSSNTQRLIRIDTDCDRDALRFVVRQSGAGFCHTGTQTCFGERTGLARLEATISQRLQDAPDGSYTRRLIEKPELLRAKLHEEADELLDAESPCDAAHEAADVVFFALTRAIHAGATLEEIERELDRRAMSVTRRAGNAKPQYQQAECGS